MNGDGFKRLSTMSPSTFVKSGLLSLGDSREDADNEVEDEVVDIIVVAETI